MIGMIREGRLRLSWYHWIVGAGWYAALAFITAFIAINVQEGESQAAGMSLLIFGGGLLVTGILLYRLLFKPRMAGRPSGDAARAKR